jgi:hypothetical protein
MSWKMKIRTPEAQQSASASEEALRHWSENRGRQKEMVPPDYAN